MSISCFSNIDHPKAWTPGGSTTKQLLLHTVQLLQLHLCWLHRCGEISHVHTNSPVLLFHDDSIYQLPMSQSFSLPPAITSPSRPFPLRLHRLLRWWSYPRFGRPGGLGDGHSDWQVGPLHRLCRLQPQEETEGLDTGMDVTSDFLLDVACIHR